MLRQARKARPAAPARARLHLEQLEDRTVLSTLSVPAYNSLPGAHASIYLNFTGENLGSWLSYSNVNIPAYDQNGDATTFTSSELNSIYLIWQNVAEDYAPFNINVTTVNPRSVAGYTGGVTQIDVGGNGAWMGGGAGGIAQIGGFSSSSASNPVRGFAFSASLGNGNPKYTADSAAHESGHTFGLQHQSQYSGSTQTAEYYLGPGDGTAPIMGDSYSAARSLWWYGTSTLSSSSFQNDMAVIAANTNVGYRPDGQNNSIATASPMVLSGSQISTSGIISQMSDVDCFSFVANPGVLTLTGSDPAPSPDLSMRLQLLDASGNVLASATAITTNFTANVSYTLTTAGTYYVMVTSSGTSSKSTATNYGFNVGQYMVNGSVVAPSDIINAPTGLTASSKSTTNQITLTWTNNATNATGILVQRSSDGTNWTTIASSLASTTTSYVDAGLSPATTFSYRVQAFTASANSLFSNQVKGTTVPLIPTGLTATVSVAGQIGLTWSKVSGATGYQVQRSTDGVNWKLIASTSSTATQYQDVSLAASTTYYYRVRAGDAGGSSPYGSSGHATTLAQTVAPSAPSGLVATAMLATQIRLTWKDTSANETGFAIERSSDGLTGWTQIAQVGANVTSYTDNTALAQHMYYYRIRAFDSAGYSSYSGTAKATTPQSAPDPGRELSPARHGQFSCEEALILLFASEWAHHQRD